MDEVERVTMSSLCSGISYVVSSRVFARYWKGICGMEDCEPPLILVMSTGTRSELSSEIEDLALVCVNGIVRGAPINGCAADMVESRVELLACFSAISDLVRLCGRAVKLSSKGLRSGGSCAIWRKMLQSQAEIPSEIKWRPPLITLRKKVAFAIVMITSTSVLRSVCQL
jgi:hypothetical protein